MSLLLPLGRVEEAIRQLRIAESASMVTDKAWRNRARAHGGCGTKGCLAEVPMIGVAAWRIRIVHVNDRVPELLVVLDPV
jgi:hypothetical protein